MVSAEIAFRSDTPLKALVLLSPTVIDEASWRDGIPLGGVFRSSSRTAGKTTSCPSPRRRASRRPSATAGLTVTWVPFDGSHEMPAPVITALNEFLATVDR